MGATRTDSAGLCPVPGCVKHPRHIGRHLIRFATGEDEGVAFLPTIPEAGAARSDGAASGETRTRRRSQRSFSPLVESASGEESERTDETMSPRDDEGPRDNSPAGASGEEHDGAADNDPHQCHVPGCIKQARHVGRHKVRLPDGAIPKGPYGSYPRKLTPPERKSLRQRKGFLQADFEGGIPPR